MDNLLVVRDSTSTSIWFPPYALCLGSMSKFKIPCPSHGKFVQRPFALPAHQCSSPRAVPVFSSLCLWTLAFLNSFHLWSLFVTRFWLCWAISPQKPKWSMSRRLQQSAKGQNHCLQQTEQFQPIYSKLFCYSSLQNLLLQIMPSVHCLHLIMSLSCPSFMINISALQDVTNLRNGRII